MRLPAIISIIPVVLLSSCAATGYKAKPGTPTTLTVGVKQFTAPNYASLPAGDKGIRDYEGLALPAMLVQTLNGTPGVSKAYFVPANTPGVDLIVDGNISYSNGRDLSLVLTVTRIDGKVLAQKNVALSHSSTDVNGIRQATSALMNQAAGVVASTRQKFKYDPDDLRSLVYASAKVPSTPELVRMGQEAATVERNQVFTPLTSALLPRINGTADVYYQWQKESVPFINQQKAAEAEKANAEAQQMMGALMSGLGGFVGGYSASLGDASGVLSSTMLMTSGMETAAEGAAQEAVADNKIKELAAVLATFKNKFSTGDARQITVRIYNKVHTLKGSKEEMTAAFRKIVKEEMDKELQKAQVTPVVAQT